MRRSLKKPASGFTLIELMMVVAILGILAVIAIPRYRSYVYRSKMAEAVGFLSEIKSRQESYRADFGSYCAINGQTAKLADNVYYPSSLGTDKMYLWEQAPASGSLGLGYRQLGAYPPGLKTYFQYQVVAGPPGTQPSGDTLGFTGSDFWFVSRAKGDLDNDGTPIYVEGYSASSGLWYSNAAGWE
ncbi:MAG TPA: prepilin-type N-terminal cleavage/methylation domain-containing protein [Polyangiales bacterium]|nr:prepilin-type N-terminal cleavage/methylation domain-containing protein [Polyangiales bacterium]